MEEIKALSEQIKDKQALIESIQADIARCNDTIAQGTVTVDGDEAATLNEKRRAIVAQAFIDRVSPDTSEVDAQIAQVNAERAKRAAENSAVRAEAQAAQDALQVLNGRRDEAEHALGELTDQQRAAVSDYLLSAHDAAEKQYLEIVDSMQKPIETMAGAQRAWYAVFPHDEFPGYGESALTDIRSKGVRVPWDRSALRDPSVAAEYPDNFQQYWYVPEWAASSRVDFGDMDMTTLLSDVRAAGVTVSDPATKEDQTVEIEVVLGSIVGTQPGSVTRNPADGSVIASKRMNFGPGKRLTVAKSDASTYVKAGFARYAADIDSERAAQAQKRSGETAVGSGRTTVHQQEPA